MRVKFWFLLNNMNVLPKTFITLIGVVILNLNIGLELSYKFMESIEELTRNGSKFIYSCFCDIEITTKLQGSKNMTNASKLKLHLEATLFVFMMPRR